MRKILHITGSLDRNGTETFIMNVYRHINKKNLQFDFLLFTESTDGYYEEAESLGAKIYRLPTRRKGMVNYYRELYLFFKKHHSEYTGIHFSACSLTTIFPIICSMFFKIPIRIVHAHSTSWEGIHNYAFHQINRLLIPFIATDFLACSDNAIKWFYPFYIRRSCKIIKNGIEIKKYAYSPEIRKEYRRLFNIENAFVIGHVGRFVEVKNHIFLLYILRQVLTKIPNAKLVLVGDGELRPYIIEQVSQMKLNDHVIFLGQRTDVEKIIQSFDCFLMPSLYEGLPFVLLEAQCSGLKVLASDSVSPETKVTNNISFLSLNQKISIWADSINGFTTYYRKDESESIKNKGYSIENTVVELNKIYLKE